MADQGRWFKLWCSSLVDPSLDNLDIADFGRWAKFGAYLKEQGTDGTVTIQAPARGLCGMLQVDTFDALLCTIRKWPNVTVTGETNATVTFQKWQKYQGDNSLHRVQQFRERVTAKKRREEKRGDERREPPPNPPGGGLRALRALTLPDGFENFWNAYPKDRRRGRQEAIAAWRALRLTPEQIEQVMASLESWKASHDWAKDGGKYIPWPQKFLRKHRWEETLDPDSGRDRDELPPLRL